MRLRQMEDLHRFDSDGQLVDSVRTYAVSRTALKSGAASGDTTVLDGSTDDLITGTLDAGESNDGDFISIVLTAGVTYSFGYRPAAVGGIEDPYLILRTEAGGVIAEDDDGGLGRSSLITFTPTTTGTYQLQAASWVNLFDSGGDTGDYTIDVWSSSSPDTPATTTGAFQITDGTTTFGQVASGTDVDVYKISLEAGRFYTFNYSGGVAGGAEFGEPGGSVATLDLLDADGNIVATGLNFESGMTFLNENTGDYFVRITPFNGTTGGYELNVASVNLAEEDPLEAFIWDSADNIPTVMVDGVPTAYVYFAVPGENFGEVQSDDGADGVPESGDEDLISLGWNAFEKQQVLLMLNQEYGKILGINYVETTDSTQATFRLITTHDEDAYGARFYPRDEAEYGTQMGIGTFNTDSHAWTFDGDPNTAGVQQISLEQGGFAWELLMHEFGHAHGIAHPHDNGGGSEIMVGVTAAQGSFGVYNLNQSVYSVMSYNSTWHFSPDGPTPFAISSVDSGSVGTLSPFDIAVLEKRYGPGLPLRETGDNIYDLTDVQDDAFYRTIWDHGGNDTIRYGGPRNLGAVIDLTAATLDYTPTGGGVISYLLNPPGLPNSQIVRGGFLIANGVEIENATGGGGNDMLLGNALNNVLTGNGGNDVLMGRLGDDTLIGGAGSDTAAYNDAAAAVTVDLATDSATGGDGTDALESIENAIGSKHNDRLTGDGDANILDGNDGDDSMDGVGGVDTASYATATSRVSVSLALQGGAQDTLGAGSDTLLNFENLTGSAFGDRLIGDGSANVIKGGDGVDVATLGGGNDTFIGEITALKGTLKTGTMSVDIITDFDASGAGNDVIDLSGLGDFQFRGTAQSKRPGDVTYKQYDSVNGAEHALGFDIDGNDGAGASGPVTVVYVNTNGGAADAAIILLNSSGVDANDFILS